MYVEVPAANVVTTCRFGSLLACETFHADVHAGNLLVLNDGRVGFIDFGWSMLLRNTMCRKSVAKRTLVP